MRVLWERRLESHHWSVATAEIALGWPESEKRVSNASAGTVVGTKADRGRGGGRGQQASEEGRRASRSHRHRAKRVSRRQNDP